MNWYDDTKRQPGKRSGTHGAASERFASKVNKNGPNPTSRPNLGPCWLWQGQGTKQGYGRFYINGRKVLAHCYAYAAQHGPVPHGLELDHLCRNRACVNPAHLEPVTKYTNIMRGESPSAKAARATHCAHGHPFDAANTYTHIDSRGRTFRQCRQCKVVRQREYMERKKERQVQHGRV